MGEDLVQFAVREALLLVGCSEQRGLGTNLSKAQCLVGRYYSG
jgi:hypothetical protein